MTTTHETHERLTAPGDLLDELELSALLNIKPATLRNWRALKQGPHFLKLGKRAVRYRRADVEAFIAGDADEGKAA